MPVPAVPAPDGLLDRAPCGIALSEPGRLIWANRTLCDLLGLAADEAIPVGFPPDARLTALLGDDETFAVIDRAGITHWLRRLPAAASTDRERWDYFVDITREIELATEIDALKVRDSETGMLNRKGILAALDKQLARTRRYGNPLAVARLEFRSDSPPLQCAASVAAVMQELRVQLRWVDEIGRLDTTCVLLVLPETDAAGALQLLDTLQRERIEPLQRDGAITTEVAVTAWQKGDDQRRLLERLGWPPSAQS
jgi:GGDEF domain-containing protein